VKASRPENHKQEKLSGKISLRKSIHFHFSSAGLQDSSLLPHHPERERDCTFVCHSVVYGIDLVQLYISLYAIKDAV
jgi:hypothetical protein